MRGFGRLHLPSCPPMVATLLNPHILSNSKFTSTYPHMLQFDTLSGSLAQFAEPNYELKVSFFATNCDKNVVFFIFKTEKNLLQVKTHCATLFFIKNICLYHHNHPHLQDYEQGFLQQVAAWDAATDDSHHSQGRKFVIFSIFHFFRRAYLIILFVSFCFPTFACTVPVI